MDTQKNYQPYELPLSSDQIHLSDYISIIRKRKGIIIIFSLALIGITAAFSFLSTPVYQATAQIIIEKNISLPTGSGDLLDRDTRNDNFYQTQLNLLQSRGLALKVIEDLKLWEDFYREPVKEGAHSNITSDAVSNAGKGISSTFGATHTVTEPQKTPGILTKPDKAMIIDWYLSNLKIEPFRDSQIANISFLSRSPETAARVANAHAHAFIDKTLQMKIAAFRNGLSWITEQLVAQKNKLEASQSVMVLDSEIMDLRDQLDKLKAKKLEIAANYGPKHPKITDIDSGIRQLEGKIREYKNSPAAVGQAGSGNQGKSNYEVLKQEVLSDQQNYDLLLKQAKELGLASLLDTSNISIVDEAEVPQIPVKPRTFLNILLAIVMSMFMGPFLAFFLEYMDNTVKTPEDIQHKLGMPALGMIPFYNSKNGKKNTALFWDNSVRKKGKYAKTYYGSDAANPLIPGIQVALQKTPHQAFFIQSAEAGEGKTTVLANAGLRLSKNGFKVLMVDADFKHPSLHRMFGIENKDGLVNAINQILSQSINAGTLDTCSVDDLFTIISLKKLSGSLAVTNNSHAISAVFENGRLYHLESRDNPVANRLGAMLVRGGFITNTQLEDALEWNQRTGMPLGYILINAGYLTHEQLRGPLKLQIEEQLQKLFSWKNGSFRFEQKDLKKYENNKIYIEEDYTGTIQRLSRSVGSRLFEGEILSHIKTLTNPDVSLLTSGAESPKVSGMVFVMLLSKFIDILKQRFDIVLVDTPPLLEDPDATLLSSISDGVILVVKAGNLSVKAIREASTGIKEVNAKVLGAVLNHVKS